MQLRLVPAAAGQGIVFRRTDRPVVETMPATLDQVTGSERRTVLGSGPAGVATVEHLLAAVVAAEIDDLTVEVDGPELPICDGSFAPFVALLQEAGRAAHHRSRRSLLLDRAFEVSDGESRYRVEPAARLRLKVTLEHSEPVIGRQSAELTVTAAAFALYCAGARTYGFEAEVAPLRARGLLAGATLDSAILCSATAVVNTTLRWPNEFARHKLGDLLGDLALLGVRPRVRITAERPSHRGNLTCMRSLARAGRIEEDG
ncbi:MAG: UDP-3-O-acyl-N-acetylglucosamine deacetylase [Gemmatimonadota bacterium]|nr:UDP-3-O-acyl-N-acetylglucosamine deacetylase [Gemmatimonadota bacterium]